uniref:Putative D-lactate dehydrogenase n=1 Tax=Mastigamoeba balamuthi TaxID=108607 RepID=Q7Z019_MASBA|nr:putative D-lactate dehydrogenase [Mastigamoeba balamuthi]
MRITFFSTKPYDSANFTAAASSAKWAQRLPTELVFHTQPLTLATVHLAKNSQAVCVFVNDDCGAPVLQALHAAGVRLLLLRCAGFNNVDLAAADALGLAVMRVPRYSPNAVAEHAVTLAMALNRRIVSACNRVKQFNFSLEGLQGFDVAKRTVGVVGTGAIGKITARIMIGFGAKVLLFDQYPDRAWAQKLKGSAVYVPFDELLRRSDIISLHMPMTPQSRHIINANTIRTMKHGVMLINTSRGGLLDTPAVIEGLVSGQIGYLGIDVYENETPYFFQDHSGRVMKDPVLARLLSFPNVIMTAHQAFMTEDAMQAISNVSLENAEMFLKGTWAGNPNQCTQQKGAAPARQPVAMPAARL